jgi:DNA polymerase
MTHQKRLFYLQEIGIKVWVERKLITNNNLHSPKGTTMATEKLFPLAHPEEIAEMDWTALEKAVEHCQRCELYKTRTHAVFGSGNRQAKLLIIGEAPGMNEDKEGKPFVGRAGQLLTSMLHSIQVNRDEIYIANVLKSRPPNNREPKPEEVAACTPYLLRQIALIQPDLILALGRIASHYLLNTPLPMGQLRGKTFYFGEQKIPLFVTYHPAYLLRAPREKLKAWEDIQRVREFFAPTV